MVRVPAVPVVRFVFGLLLSSTLSACGDSGTAPEASTQDETVPANVTVTPDSVGILVGDSTRVSFEVRAANGGVLTGQTADWSSGTPNVATVSASGWVRGIGEGTATITATVSGVRDSARVVVVAPVPVARVVVEPETLSLRLGQAAALKVETLDEGGALLLGRRVAWSSTAEDVLTVAAHGVVSARGAGSAYVLATVEGVADSIEVTVTELQGGLSEAHTEQLTGYLNVLSDLSWTNPAREGAIAIFSSSSYTSADYQAFFSGYFLRHPLTPSLTSHLESFLFYGSGGTNARLQTALLPVARDRLSAILLEQGVDPEAALADDFLDQALIGYTDLFRKFAVAARGLPEFRAAADLFFLELMAEHPHLFESVSQRRGLRRLNAMAFLGALEAETLTVGRRTELASRFGLSGRAASIFTDRGVFVYERFNLDGQQQRISGSQLRVIDDVMGAVPPELHDLRSIFISDAFGLFPGSYHCCYYWRQVLQSIISIGAPPLNVTEVPFPTDIEARATPQFTTILAHELGHVIDNVQTRVNAAYRSRMQALLMAAGADSRNYLRSMIPDGFFLTYPVELFASTSQVWLADTEHTLRLARKRFDEGRPHPMHQALWMAETFSRGGPTTTLFDMTDSSGSVAVRTAPLTRDTNGHIESLVVGDSMYTFQRNTEGDVLSYEFVRRP